MTRPLPLAGTLVVALEQAVALPLATRKLADAGARVIKVERPEGDFARGYDKDVLGGSSHFMWLNRGKESVVIDLKKESDAALLRRMIARADVFMQNLAPGAAARAGFGSGNLRRTHPRLVTCDVSGYGQTGPYADMKAYDNLVQGETGLQSITGTADSPARVGISICDISAGMHVYGAVLEALLLRARTGEGAALELSLFDAMADWMSVPYLLWTYAGKEQQRTGLRHPGIAPYGPYKSSQGDVVLIAIQNEREWERLCSEVVGKPELSKDARFVGNPKRMENRPALEAILEAAFAALTTEELVERLRSGAVAFGRVNTIPDFAAHPQLRLVEVDTPGGKIAMPDQPVVWERGEEVGEERMRVPAVGEQDTQLRREFGIQ